VSAPSAIMPHAPIYLDNHATTRTDPRVVEAMLPFFTERYGNAASRTHRFGWDAEEAVKAARAQVAELIGAQANEIIFTSGATESNNLAILGVAQRQRRSGGRLLSATTEHKAVLDPLAKLARRGFDVTIVPIEPSGSRRAGPLGVAQRVDALGDFLAHDRRRDQRNALDGAGDVP